MKGRKEVDSADSAGARERASEREGGCGCACERCEQAPRRRGRASDVSAMRCEGDLRERASDDTLTLVGSWSAQCAIRK